MIGSEGISRKTPYGGIHEVLVLQKIHSSSDCWRKGGLCTITRISASSQKSDMAAVYKALTHHSHSATYCNKTDGAGVYHNAENGHRFGCGSELCLQLPCLRQEIVKHNASRSKFDEALICALQENIQLKKQDVITVLIVSTTQM